MCSLKYNDEHYRDETAYKAIRTIEKDDTKRLKAALKAARAALDKFGFDTAGRIILIDRQTGKIYR
ncbi:hypothetical protein [Pectinatus haikarae]|uniref:Uncharacterized protein n=1 Tax=Pectinatus haikarae TaxID=349096 RepID=A0ABT9YA61_9FIRM|nr:hypothetical protein [Pectinatus haikarae]MDQ0204087.1 hypothetical protein [Pectinatus haikarae]